MCKIYFEMNDAEKVFHRIAHDLDWAETMMAEGFLMGHEEIQMDVEQFQELYDKAEECIAEALSCIYDLEKAVQEPDEAGGDNIPKGAEGETWTLQEVQSIVDLVRAGKPVQIAPYDPDVDDDPYIVRPCW